MQHVDSFNGLQNGRVYQLGEDFSGRLWVGTGQGVDVFDAHGVEHFGQARGMAGDDCDANAFLADPDGDVWVGTSTGLGRFIGGNYAGPPDPPQPAIVEASVGGTRLWGNGVQRIEEKAPVLEVHFAGLSFLDEARVQHEVRLLPLETQFRKASVREARYGTLAPGNYTFEVRARMPPGLWSEPARVEFVLLPRWWQTAWFRVLAAAAGALVIGVLVNWRVRELSRRNRELEKQVGARTGELAAANQALRDLSVSDPLTGLKNRRYLELAMPETVAQVMRNQREEPPPRNADLLLLVIDLDDFKAINDTWGHTAGDRVLQQAGGLVAQICRESDSAGRWGGEGVGGGGGHTAGDRVLQQAGGLVAQICRESDSAVRWGGEEFVVVARNADRAMAGAVAERICELFRKHRFEVGGGKTIAVTCSVGVAAYPFALDAELPWEEVVALADHGLYAAKRAGKDCWAAVTPSQALTAETLRRHLDGDFARLVSSGEVVLTLSSDRAPPLSAAN